MYANLVIALASLRFAYFSRFRSPVCGETVSTRSVGVVVVTLPPPMLLIKHSGFYMVPLSLSFNSAAETTIDDKT